MPQLWVLFFGALVPSLQAIWVREEDGAMPCLRSHVDLVEKSLAHQSLFDSWKLFSFSFYSRHPKNALPTTVARHHFAIVAIIGDRKLPGKKPPNNFNDGAREHETPSRPCDASQQETIPSTSSNLSP